MRLTRRHALGLAGGLAAAPVFSSPRANAPIIDTPRVPTFRSTLDRLAACSVAERAGWSLPGLTVAVRAADRRTAGTMLDDAVPGVAPAKPAHLFQIGSISKSLIAMALFRLAGKRRLELDAPIGRLISGLPLAAPSINIGGTNYRPRGVTCYGVQLLRAAA